MKILRIISTMNPESGGPCQGIRNSIPALEKLGVRNEVVSIDDPNEKFLGKDSFPVHALGPAKSAWNYSTKLIPWLQKNLIRFDVVIVDGIWLYHSYAVMKTIQFLKAKNQSKIPRYYIMPHGMLDPYFQKAPGRKFKAFRNWIYWKLIENRVINKTNGLLFTCETEMNLAKETFSPYNPVNEFNIGYGVKTPPPYSESMKLIFSKSCPELDGSPYLLFLSRIHEKKGIDLLVKAYAKQKRSTDLLPKLVIAGPGLNTEYGKKVLSCVSRNPALRNDVLFPGMLSGEEKWGAFYGCEAFILPSHQENFGIAVVEAMACGKPVLISKQVNIWREIEQGQGGIVEQDSEEGVLTMLQKWQQMTEHSKRKMGDNARIIFDTRFGIDQAANSMYEAIF